MGDLYNFYKDHNIEYNYFFVIFNDMNLINLKLFGLIPLISHAKKIPS